MPTSGANVARDGAIIIVAAGAIICVSAVTGGSSVPVVHDAVGIPGTVVIVDIIGSWEGTINIVSVIG